MKKKTLIQSKNNNQQIIAVVMEDIKRHNMEVDRLMHSGDAKIVDLIGEHLQTKEN